MPGSVFISYRTADTGHVADRLESELSKRFGPDVVFLDRRGLHHGERLDLLLDEVRRATAVIVLIGKSWLRAHDEHGIRRLDLPNDWVRREVECALESKRPILPMLVDDTKPLEEEAFQTVRSLEVLASLRAERLRRSDFNHDLDALCERLTSLGLVVHRAPPPQSRAPVPPSRVRITIPPLLPYQSDRHDQLDWLGDHLPKQPARPIIVFMHGDERQAHSRFVELLYNRLLPKLLELPNTGFESRPLAWSDKLNASLEARRSQLRRRLAAALGTASDASIDEMAKAASSLRRPLLLTSTLFCSSWARTEKDLLRWWLSFWGEWPNTKPGMPLVVVVEIHYKSEDGWFLKRRARRRKNRIRRELEALEIEGRSTLTGLLLPELGNVHKSHVVHWLRDPAAKFFKDHKIDQTYLFEKVEPRVSALFEGRDEPGIAMGELGPWLRDLTQEVIDDDR